jgi:UDP-N-acetylglucosamine 4-epimerase
MKTIAVIGGAGFIGSAICKSLIDKNYRVKCIDNLSSGTLNNIESLLTNDLFEFKNINILHQEELNYTLQGVDAINHQAALTSVIQSNENPSETFNINVNGFLNVLEAARINGIKKVVYASSSAVYGDVKVLPIKETTKLNPISIYGLSKKLNEELAEYYFKNYTISTIGLRYFNVFGPNQNLNSDYAAVIPIFINKCINNLPITIYGDGLQTRDFIYVEDVAEANYKALLSESNSSEVFNIGTGTSISVLELANSIRIILNNNNPIKFLEKRKGEIPHSLADVTLANDKLIFKSSYALDLAINQTCKWYKN